ncbi:hypothetical protein E4U58_004045 [Claviceps cyperi]|nr:hypothetical protein E4U58_004045 [Claviceps cyperi]
MSPWYVLTQPPLVNTGLSAIVAPARAAAYVFLPFSAGPCSFFTKLPSQCTTRSRPAHWKATTDVRPEVTRIHVPR